jgi:hypothetical protein
MRSKVLVEHSVIYRARGGMDRGALLLHLYTTFRAYWAGVRIAECYWLAELTI